MFSFLFYIFIFFHFRPLRKVIIFCVILSRYRRAPRSGFSSSTVGQSVKYLSIYYRKRGSASYIVREVHSVRERERERYRERRKWRHHCRAKIGNEFARSLCQKFAQLAMSLHFPLPKTRTFRFSLHTSRLSRKGDCAWSCSRLQTQPEKICKSQRTNQCHSLRTLYWFALCNLQIFSGCVCNLEQLHAQSPFLFPIVFSIKASL